MVEEKAVDSLDRFKLSVGGYCRRHSDDFSAKDLAEIYAYLQAGDGRRGCRKLMKLIEAHRTIEEINRLMDVVRL